MVVGRGGPDRRVRPQGDGDRAGEIRASLEWTYRDWLARSHGERRAVEARLQQVTCLQEGCGVEWDPRRCPSCDCVNDPLGETCSKCGETWNPDACPACKGEERRGHTKAELLYAEAPEGTLCLTCGHVWRPSFRGEKDACPACGGVDLGTAYPQIPDLEGEPELQVILWADGCIPRAENGAILHREMLSWLRYHGVRERSEVNAWEGWFRFVGAERSRLTEEMMAPTETEEGRDREEE